MKNGPIRRIKNFVGRHQLAIVAGASAFAAAAAMYKLQNGAIKTANGFIEEKGLTAEFIASLG